jgi:hypothetical protein
MDLSFERNRCGTGGRITGAATAADPGGRNRSLAGIASGAPGYGMPLPSPGIYAE